MPGPQAGPDGSEGMDEKMMERMAAMFAGLRVAMSFVVPGEIIESNAMQVEGKRASWIYDIDEDPKILSKLGKQEEMRLVFLGEGLDLKVPRGPSKDEEPENTDYPE